jgi:CcmD family protein
MSPESLLAAAYAVTWILVAAYLVRLARRQRRLEADVRALRAEVDGERVRPAPAGTPGEPAGADAREPSNDGST